MAEQAVGTDLHLQPPALQQPQMGGPCRSPVPAAFSGGGFAFLPKGPACGAGAGAGEGGGKPSPGSDAMPRSSGSFFPAWPLVVALFSGAAAAAL